MPMYVTLANFTDQGIRNYTDTAKRAKAFMEMAEEMGAKVKDIYWTMGSYDLVTITEAPDDETATAMALRISSMGNVRTTSMRGFSMEEIDRIIQNTG